MKAKNIHPDVWMGAMLILASVVFYLLANQFSNQNAATWPKAILIGIIILSAMLVIRGLSHTRQDNLPQAVAGLWKGPTFSLLMIVAYALLMNFTGYFVSTAIFLPLGMFALGQRNWKVIFGVSVGLELFVYVLFVMQLQLRMP